jgi:hypothetical protein
MEYSRSCQRYQVVRSGIVKETLVDEQVPLIAEIRGKNRSLRVLGIGREICNGDADLVERAVGVHDLPALKSGVNASPVDSDKENSPYPYFGLRERTSS